MIRPTIDKTMLDVANTLAQRGTCSRRKVGCVIVNKHNHIIATGYNGVASGLEHCIYKPCLGANKKSGESLDLCEAIHAEQNALLQCKDTQDIYTIYCTHSPCVHCVKLIMNTSCQRIVFKEKYSHLESEELARKKNIEWIHLF